MSRCFSVVAVALVACLCVAAPAPGDKDNVAGWGTFLDPDKDCSFKLDKGKLTVTVPGKAHDLGAERNQMNAPRVVQDVEGDFIVQVRVSGTFKPGQQVLEDRAAYNGAGLALFADEKTYIRIERATFTRGCQDVVYTNFELRDNGQLTRFGSGEDHPLMEGKDTFLRLERNGDKVLGAVRQEGETTWHYLEAKTAKLPKKLQVGVAAVNTSDREFSPQFAEFKLFREEPRKPEQD